MGADSFCNYSCSGPVKGQFRPALPNEPRNKLTGRSLKLHEVHSLQVGQQCGASAEQLGQSDYSRAAWKLKPSRTAYLNGLTSSAQQETKSPAFSSDLSLTMIFPQRVMSMDHTSTLTEPKTRFSKTGHVLLFPHTLSQLQTFNWVLSSRFKQRNITYVGENENHSGCKVALFYLSIFELQYK